jgi:hypothetical protein
MLKSKFLSLFGDTIPLSSTYMLNVVNSMVKALIRLMVVGEVEVKNYEGQTANWTNFMLK